MNHKNFIALVTAMAIGILGFSAVPAQAGSHVTNHQADFDVFTALSIKIAKSKHKKHHFGHVKREHGKGFHGHSKKHSLHHGKRYKKHHKYGFKKYNYGKRYHY